MRRRIAGWRTGLVALGLLAAIGCSGGPPTGDVSGSVTVDGKQAGDGAITFIPADGKAGTAGAPIVNGNYTALKVPVGTAKVEIRIPKVVGKIKAYDTPESPWEPDMAESLPAKYNQQTELRLEVQRGKNDKDWHLKSK